MDEERSARVFLAVGISAAIAAVVARVQTALGAVAPAGLFRLVDPGQMHVTLQFLGQRTPEEQRRIVGAAAAVAPTVAPFALAFEGLGVFPDERRPHTLWMGLTRGRAEIVALAARLQTELAAAGFAPEARPFAPHLTLARIKQRPAPGLITKLHAAEIERAGPERVDSFALMESRVTSAGVRYLPLRNLRLEGACTPSE
jgi:2'-5' RNA ligase